MSVKRFDAAPLGKSSRTPQGGLRVPAYPTRTGVFPYRQDDGSVRREYRPAEEVFSADSLASLRAAPVTDLHPSESLVNSDNWKQLAVGHVSEDVRSDGQFVATDLLIQDAATIALVEKGDRKELSCGYSCDLEDTQGTANGERYDAIQRNIRYNHVAIGPPGWGRAGPAVALRLDEKDHEMKVIRIDGVEYEYGSEKHIAYLEKQTLDEMSKTETEKKRADAAEKARDEEKSRADSEKLRADSASDPKAMLSAVNARCNLLDSAKAIMGDRFDSIQSETLSDIEIMGSVLKSVNARFDSSTKTPDFIRGAFEALTLDMAEDDEEEEGGGEEEGEGEQAGSTPRKDHLEARRGSRNDSRFDPNADPVETAKNKSRADSHNAWKLPLQASRKD